MGRPDTATDTSRPGRSVSGAAAAGRQAGSPHRIWQVGAAELSGRPAGTHHIEGGGTGQWPDQLSAADFDEVLAVPEAEAFAMARRAARADGIFSGPSTGANLVAALTLARRFGPGSRLVTVQVDSGLKYLAGGLYG